MRVYIQMLVYKTSFYSPYYFAHLSVIVASLSRTVPHSHVRPIKIIKNQTERDEFAWDLSSERNIYRANLDMRHN